MNNRQRSEEEQQAALKARIKQRVKDFLPAGFYQISVEEVACADQHCLTRTTVISICDEAGRCRNATIHAPLNRVTTKEIAPSIKTALSDKE